MFFAGIEFVLAHAQELRAIAHAEQKHDRVDARLLPAGLSYPRGRLKTREGRRWLTEEAAPVWRPSSGIWWIPTSSS